MSPGRRRASHDRMPLVAQVLEMLWAAQQRLNVDFGLWDEWEPGRAPASGPGARSGAGDTEVDAATQPPPRTEGRRDEGRPSTGGEAGAGGRPTGWYARRWRPVGGPRRPRQRSAAGAPPAPIDPSLRQCYLDLGVQVGSRFEAVRSAWRRLVREHHPDLHGNDPDRLRRGTERIKELNRSYEALKWWFQRGR